MTREEAIEIFEHNWTRLENHDYTEEELNEALEMAIKALEKEPCNDAISRQAAIEAVKQAIYNHDSAIMRLADLPSITPSNTQRVNSVLECVGNYISRQAAIDTIESWLSCNDYNESERHIMRAMQSVLYDLPSVTPSNTPQRVNSVLERVEDCISREEAIEWMENIRTLNQYYHPKENDDETLVSEVHDADSD